MGLGLIKFKFFWQKFDFKEGGVSVVFYLERIIFRLEIVLWVYCCYEKSIKDFNFYQYNLFSNNCEYFVIYCVIGEMISLQVEVIEICILSFFIKKFRFDWE